MPETGKEAPKNTRELFAKMTMLAKFDKKTVGVLDVDFFPDPELLMRISLSISAIGCLAALSSSEVGTDV